MIDINNTRRTAKSLAETIDLYAIQLSAVSFSTSHTRNMQKNLHDIERRRGTSYVSKVSAFQSVILDLPDSVVLFKTRRAKDKEHQLRILGRRARQDKSVVLNLTEMGVGNTYSDHKSVSDFRFFTRAIGKISEMLQWSGVSERNEYRRDGVVETCIMLHRIGTTSRW